MHLYSSKSSFLSNYSSTSFSSFFSFSYSNSAVKEYCDRIHSCMNYLASHAIFSESFTSFLIFSCSIHEFHRAAQHLMNLLQCVMTCFIVFLIWLHEQTNDEKLRTWVLFKKTASLLQFMQICMIIELSVFCSCVWSLTTLWLKDLTFSKFYFRNLLVQQHFHLYISAYSADISALSFSLSQQFVHWIWHSLIVSLDSLYHICSLFWIHLQNLMTSFFISDYL